MKQLNKFINEKLTLNNQSKLQSDFSDYNDTIDHTQILEEIGKAIGFDMDEYNEYPYKIIKEWIYHYNIDQIEMVVDDTTFNEFLLEPNKDFDKIDITVFSKNETENLFTKNALNKYYDDKSMHIFTNNKKLNKCLILSFKESNSTYNVLMYNRKLTSKY